MYLLFSLLPCWINNYIKSDWWSTLKRILAGNWLWNRLKTILGLLDRLIRLNILSFFLDCALRFWRRTSYSCGSSFFVTWNIHTLVFTLFLYTKPDLFSHFSNCWVLFFIAYRFVWRLCSSDQAFLASLNQELTWSLSRNWFFNETLRLKHRSHNGGRLLRLLTISVLRCLSFRRSCCSLCFFRNFFLYFMLLSSIGLLVHLLRRFFFMNSSSPRIFGFFFNWLGFT